MATRLRSAAQGALVSTSPSTVQIQSTIVYTSYLGGDVVFRLTTNTLPECYGFWLRSSDPGFKNSLAVLLAQIQAQGSLSVWVDDAQVWSGSANAYCLVYNLQF